MPDGVVVLSHSKPARTQRLQTALGMAAPGAVVTGREAMWLHGLHLHPRGAIHLLVDGRARERNDGSVVVERVRKLPDAQWRERFPVTSLARATVDACLRTTAYGEIRVLVLEALYRGGVRLEELHRELPARREGSSALRAVLAEQTAMTKSTRSRLARNVVELAGLPPPVWDVRLSTADDVYLGRVDAWWPEVGLAWDAGIHDSWEPRTTASTTTRMTRYLAAGVIATYTVPSRLDDQADTVAAELAGVYRLAMQTPLPEVRADR
ncbi:hypothetical protein ACFQV2_08905 [Actinokineospora soli]|uniref:Transcriptional regulator, AbiEi antitoxin, Type IV TA system n=1 Tax=Actinokineospora soli TaxID=1048753 RepID=A0ABW2TKD2_9PSEU